MIKTFDYKDCCQGVYHITYMLFLHAWTLFVVCYQSMLIYIVKVHSGTKAFLGPQWGIPPDTNIALGGSAKCKYLYYRQPCWNRPIYCDVTMTLVS